MHRLHRALSDAINVAWRRNADQGADCRVASTCLAALLFFFLFAVGHQVHVQAVRTAQPCRRLFYIYTEIETHRQRDHTQITRHTRSANY